MDQSSFPRTTIGGVSVSRMIMGTNFFLGGSHRTQAADRHIGDVNGNKEALADIIETFLTHGVDALVGIITNSPLLQDGIKLAEDRTGKRVIRIDLTTPNVDDTPQARRQAEQLFDKAKQAGVDFCLPLHSCVEQLVNKNKRKIERIEDYLAMIRDRGMIPGLSAHMPEVVVYADLNEYDVETYIQIYNCLGFLMQVEVEHVHRIIWEAKRPVLTIKPMAAGHTNPFVGLTFVWNSIRPQDMVAVGCLTPYEVDEDVEISRAAIERRRPRVKPRGSVVPTDVVK